MLRPWNRARGLMLGDDVLGELDIDSDKAGAFGADELGRRLLDGARVFRTWVAPVGVQERAATEAGRSLRHGSEFLSKLRHGPEAFIFGVRKCGGDGILAEIDAFVEAAARVELLEADPDGIDGRVATLALHA